MKTEIVKFDAPELGAIEKSKADQIRSTFEPMADMLNQFEDAYNSLIEKTKAGIDKAVTDEAKRLRIAIGKVRIETEKIRKEQKEEYLRAGKAIDGVSNILKWAVSDKEEKLKEIENYFEIQERKRLEALQLERVEMLSKYVEDAHERDLSGMAEDVWDAYFSTKKKAYEDMVEAEKQAELDRIAREKAEAEERERIRIEYERLRIEAEKREKEIAEERAKAEAERKAIEEAAIIAAKKAAAEKAKLEAELKAKAEAEEQAKKAEEARIEADLQKGDAAKMNDLNADLNALKTKYTFKSARNKKKYADVAVLLDKIIKFIE